METVSTTRMSSKGQIVIPESIRKQLNLKKGSQFVVVGSEDVVILKAISMPSMDDFDDLIRQARQQAKNVNLKRTDIARALKAARDRG
jgi:AbrB family looped-hinge helix DNA binding protein